MQLLMQGDETLNNTLRCFPCDMVHMESADAIIKMLEKTILKFNKPSESWKQVWIRAKIFCDTEN